MFSFTRAVPKSQLRFTVRNSFRTYVSIGDKVPATPVFEGSPGNDINLAEETASGKTILIGVPGAFSPACSASHVPGYIKNIRAFNDKGYQRFFVVAVNDPFELDLLFDARKAFGNERSKRYALIIEDGKVVKSFVEPDNTSVDVSAAQKVLEEA
ncbi:Redoxin family protein [Candida albicans]|uniref:Redoxin family protein n=1 Tax=Candida albicans TaxID=5476 RepID=A0A8H6BSI7_CANAX|nr:Redoxin family protein [Candida albicans]